MRWRLVAGPTLWSALVFAGATLAATDVACAVLGLPSGTASFGLMVVGALLAAVAATNPSTGEDASPTSHATLGALEPASGLTPGALADGEAMPAPFAARPLFYGVCLAVGGFLGTAVLG